MISRLPGSADPPPSAPARGKLYVVAAASGTGKTSLVRALMAARPQLQFPATFDAMVARGELLEWARVFDHCYGTGKPVVEQALARGESLILEIDWQGAQQVRAALPEAVEVFILPPSLPVLEERLRGRGTDSEAVIARRLAESVTELSHWREFAFVIVNDVFAEALAALLQLVDAAGGTAANALRGTRPGLAGFANALLGRPAG